MANLIITIISIALVAVAALMGAYYGGTAFLNAQTKADVNIIIKDLQQVGAALQVYALQQNGGNIALPVGIDGLTTTIATYLVPSYLQSMPYMAIYRATNGGPGVGTPFLHPGYWGTMTVDPVTGQVNASTADVTINAIMLRLDYGTRIYNACHQLVRQLYGQSALPTPRVEPTHVYVNINRKIDCAYYDINGNGVMDDDGTENTAHVVYRFN